MRGLDSFTGAKNVICAVTLLQPPRPSGISFAMCQARVERVADERGEGFRVYRGGNDPYYYTDETAALNHFDNIIKGHADNDY